MATPEGRPALPEAGTLAQSLGVPLQPFLEGMERVTVVPSSQAIPTVAQLVQAEAK